jgi:hypothetical protein
MKSSEKSQLSEVGSGYQWNAGIPVDAIHAPRASVHFTYAHIYPGPQGGIVYLTYVRSDWAEVLPVWTKKNIIMITQSIRFK